MSKKLYQGGWPRFPDYRSPSAIRWSCVRKVPWPTEAAAAGQADYLNRQNAIFDPDRPVQEAYKCRLCPAWHTGRALSRRKRPSRSKTTGLRTSLNSWFVDGFGVREAGCLNEENLGPVRKRRGKIILRAAAAVGERISPRRRARM